MNVPPLDPLEQFFSIALELLCIADTEGHFIKLNKAWETILGYPVSELEGSSFLALVHPEDMEATLASLATLSAQKPVVDFVNRYRHRDGSYRYIEWRSTPAGNQIFAVARDVTNRHEDEVQKVTTLNALEAKNDELQRFAYTVSHDLKAPLITIQGFAKGIQEALAEGNAEEADLCLNRIQKTALHMGELLQGILRLARIGKSTDPFVPTPLSEIVRRAIETTDGLLKMSGVKITIADNLPTVLGDSNRLRELFQNLIENSVKFRGPETPLIQIGAVPTPSSWDIFVQDNGVGIDPRHQNAIFGIFQKLNNKTEGTGIGLALVSRIAEIHQGSIRVESAGLGKGSTFWLTLPKI
jgi:PAS domain S-box-containing protein